MPEADLRPLIEAAFADRQLLKDPKHKAAVTIRNEATGARARRGA